VDSDRIGIIGQGLGGLVGLWTAALTSQINTLAAVAPYPCNWERHVANASSVAASEVKTYLMRYPEQEEIVWKTLSYFDPINIAHRVNCATMFPLGLEGNTAPPQDSVGVYNLIEGEKELKVLPYEGHAGGREELIRWMQARLKP
ncbi:MAG: acetylxylan esterase, partial [Candidatus Poribacteria bacterium]|nr:acetylxylan esterase [Candidatus Poribacteria bacterium]